MAANEFALPVGHDPNNVSNLNFCFDRPFLQPVNIQDYNQNFTEGLEVWLDQNDSNESNRLFAMFQAVLYYEQRNGVNSLRFFPIENASDIFNNITGPGPMEPCFNEIVYWNVDENEVSSAIESLLSNKK